MEDIHLDRQSSLFDNLPTSIGTVVLSPGTSLKYLTGLSMGPSDRPFVMLLSREHKPTVILPRPGEKLVRDRLGDDIVVDPYQDSADPVKTCRQKVSSVAKERGSLGPCAFEYHSSRLLCLDIFEGSVTWDDMEPLDPYTPEMRARKDETEIEKLRQASETIDAVLEDVTDQIEPGMTESEVEKLIHRYILDSEADGIGTLFAISGPRTASPWAQTSDRKLVEGEPLMLDVGTVYEGYYSDITRTYSLGEPNEQEWVEIYEIVQSAAREARNAAGEGVSVRDVAHAARSVIKDAGYDEYYPHRLGHGIGLGVHEKPIMVDDNEAQISEGNVFALEPGIYVDGLGGVRIEDNIAVTSTGTDVLSTTPRELEII